MEAEGAGGGGFATVELEGGETGTAEPTEAQTRIAETDEYRLSHEYYDAYKAVKGFLSADTEPPQQSDLDELSGKLKAIARRVGQLRLFSPNEELDDVSTADLKFLLVPSLIGDVLAATRDFSERARALRQALVCWRGFAADCQRLGIAHRDDARAIDRNPEDALDPATKRDEKIARHKRAKELDEQVAYLFKKKREVFGDEFHWGHGGAFDEDMERDLILKLLGRAVASAAEEIASAEQELPLLEMMAARGGPGAPPPQRPPPAEKPFIVKIQDKAECMRLYKDMVFQCPYQLPTMTLAEAADIEMEEMREREERKATQERGRRAEEDDRWFHGDRYGSKEEDEEEKKIYKDRDWDDWKDEHPWGSGNKMANIG
mmetsp:Transcript_118188/g.294845  ORF Transcript_118188/g.294845 Transcript_118188/m.294845 type:complete len:375 (+) Transcript_118188:55-1179(+)